MLFRPGDGGGSPCLFGCQADPDDRADAFDVALVRGVAAGASYRCDDGDVEDSAGFRRQVAADGVEPFAVTGEAGGFAEGVEVFFRRSASVRPDRYAGLARDAGEGFYVGGAVAVGVAGPEHGQPPVLDVVAHADG